MGQDRYNQILSQNLRIIRRSKGLTSADLAKILGVSQAKVSYIEHCKGVLSARDVAVLARKLNIPVTEFFKGLEKSEDITPSGELAGHLNRFGATLLAKPPGFTPKPLPFEEVFSQALGFIEDDRLHKAFCAALITQASTKEINVDRIFALIGNNAFLATKAAHEANACRQIISLLNRPKLPFSPRAEHQLKKIETVANELPGVKNPYNPLGPEALLDLTEFVTGCLDANAK